MAGHYKKVLREQQRGFTIVELLIVVVVIAILAAIVIIAYNGITNRANASAAQSDASDLSKLLANYNTLNNSYPNDLSTINNGGPMPTSGGTTYVYHPGAGNSSYCATITTGNSSYKIADTATNPVAGGCPGDGINGVAAITNLIPNPSFEVDLGGWNNAMKNSDTAVVTTAQANSGTHSMALTVASSSVDSYMEYFLSLQPGTYAVSAYVYLPNNGPTYGARDALFYNFSGLSSVPNTVTYNRSQLNQWQQVRAVFTTTSAGTLGVRFYGPVGTTYVDSVMATQGSSQPNYADGSSPNWIWNGTANNSTSTGPPR